jgi:selenocysteine lyase/cysteine desulfurase
MEKAIVTEARTDWRSEWFEFEDVVYLNAASIGPLPRVAVRAVQQALEWEKFPHKLPEGAHFSQPNRVRALLATLIAAQPEEIALTTGTSGGLQAIAGGIEWRPGDEVLVARGEFPAHFTTWLPLEQLGGNQGYGDFAARTLSHRRRLHRANRPAHALDFREPGALRQRRASGRAARG